ncbi:cation:proton antiporter [Desulfurella sp.]|uniref:cation:proton antiporter n=1 Tax=Desulfurella sp. TaxID=1962857 RepID=UPI0025C0C76D|nr:cation:proton antiporter [Desulfurella sp.]
MLSILFISLVLLFTQIFGKWFQSFGIPQLITYVTLGIVLGPCVFNLIKPNEIIYVFAEIGILFLLYESGLEINLKSGFKTNLKGVFVAIIGSFVPFFIALATAKLLDYNQNESFFLAGSLVATSIGVTLKTFMDLKKQHTSVANIVLVAAVIDDIIGIIMLLLVSNFAQTKTINLEIAFSVILYATILFLMVPFIKILLQNAINVSFDKDASYVSAIIFFAIMAYSFVSYKLVHLNILGAFIIGYSLQKLNLSKTSKQDNLFKKAKLQLKTLQNFFEPFFFVYIGLSFNLSHFSFSTFGGLLISLLIFLTIAILGKMVSGFFIRGFYNKLAIGLSMIPRAEVGLIFATIGKTSGILNNELYALIVIISLLTTLITPFALQLISPKIS